MGYVTNRRFLKDKETERLLQYIFGGDLDEFDQSKNANFVDFFVANHNHRRECCALKDATIREIFAYCDMPITEGIVTVNGVKISTDEYDKEIQNLSMIDDNMNLVTNVGKPRRVIFVSPKDGLIA